MPEPAVAKYTAEFVGTFVLVATIGANLNNNSSSPFLCVSIACSLAVMIYALGKSSGAHFNPAVSLAAVLSGNITWMDAFFYMVAQILAGIFAGFAYPIKDPHFNLMVQGTNYWWHPFIFEFIYTGMLCFVVLNVACSKPHAGKNQFYGIAIGFVIVAGASAGAKVTKGCFNPAVCLGLVVGNAITIESAAQLKWALVYIAAEFLGAIFAAHLYFGCRPDEFGKVRKNQFYGLVKNAHTADGNKPYYPMHSKLQAEALGTFILVTTVGCNVLGGGIGALSIAASLMCMIFALGSCSGAHFNPAVTMAAMCSGRGVCKPSEGVLYIVAQVVGGILGMMVASLVHMGETTPLVRKFHWSHVIVGEFIFTFVLAFVVLSVATVKGPLSEYFGFAIGMCVTVGGYAVGSETGGALNPAVAIGVTTVRSLFGRPKIGDTENFGFLPCGIYAATELLAGVFAAIVFRVTQPSEFPKKGAQAREKTLVEPLL